MVTKTKKDFSVAFLLQDNNNNDGSNKWDSISMLNHSTITPLAGKFSFFFGVVFNRNQQKFR